MLQVLNGETPSKDHLAKKAIFLEQSVLKETVGVQDQILTSYGGLNKVKILPSGEYEISAINISKDRIENFEERILLFYTGVSRFASDIAKKQVLAIPKNKANLHEMQKLVEIAADLLSNGNDLDDFGRLLDQTWQLKRGLESSITPSFINDIYTSGISAGALGGKLLGAGGGGFIIFYVPPEYKQSVLDALIDLLVVPFKIDFTGTELMYSKSQIYSQTSMDRSVDFLHSNSD